MRDNIQTKRKEMKVLKISLLAFAFIGLGAMGIAQDGEQDDPKANKILKEVSKKYKGYKTMYAEFTMKIESRADGSKEMYNGKLWIKGDMFKVIVAGQEIVCDAKTLWVYNEAVNEVQISKYQKNSDDFNPSEIFTIYETGFTSRLKNEFEEEGKTYQLIELNPKNKKEPYFLLKLYVNKAEQSIQTLRILYKSGSTHTYRIEKFQSNNGMEDKTFTFDKSKYTDVTEIDLR